MVEVVLLVAIGGAVLVAMRSRELFVLRVRDGKLQHVRGRIPAGLFQELAEACERQRVTLGTIRAVREANGAQLRVSGIDDFQAQRLRNIFRISPVSKFAAVAIEQDQMVRGVFSLSWLASYFWR